VRARRGAKKAICAVAASILTTAYHMLKDGTLYHHLGPDHFDHRAKTVQTERLLTPLQKLGYASRSPRWRRDPRLGFLAFYAGATI
jgi:hypothetical protein